MLKGSRLQDALEAVQKVFDKVNHKYIRKIAEQIKRIGKLNPSSVNRLTEMAEMTEGSRDIKRDLAKAIGTGKTEVNRLFTEAMNDAQNDKRFKYAFQRGKNLRPEQRQRLVQYTNLVYMQTAGTMDNLSNTTLIEQNYRDAVDEAIMAVNAGIADYGSAIRDILRKTGSQGIQVVYPSGAHRRLDTALRQNITNGAKQVSQKSAEMIGEALGYDAWELTAHLHAAPDHEPVQGHIFLQAEFDKLQAGYDFKDWKGRHYLGFPRSIGEWNCMHMALPFSTEFSKPTYTDRQLREWQEMNAQGCIYRGKHMTIYEASQYMRQIETRVRSWKDTAIAAEAAGDDILRRECQYKINTLGRQYNDIASASGLAQQRNRMAVEGFHALKAENKPQPTQNKEPADKEVKYVPGPITETPKQTVERNLKAIGYTQNEIDQTRSLFDRHTTGHEVQKEADAEILQHIKDNDRIGKLLTDKSKLEEQAWELHIQEEKQKTLESYETAVEDAKRGLEPGGIYSNYTEKDLKDWGVWPEKPEFMEPRFYRKGDMDGDVLAFSKSEKGAGMTFLTDGEEAGYIGYDVSYTLKEMKDMGYHPVAGIMSSDVGTPGEAEVLFVKMQNREKISGLAGIKTDAENTQLVNAAGKPVTKVTHTRTHGEPESITQYENKNGGIDRNYYGKDGKQTKQISNSGHGHSKESKIGEHGEHAHDYIWNENGKMKRGKARPLTDEERRENDDIIKGRKNKK